MITDEKRQLKLEDTAGLPAGHVPRGLSHCFRTIMDQGGHICAVTIGDPVPSFPPWPAQQEVGGGVVIPCHYYIFHTDKALVMKLLKSALTSMPEGEFMRIE